MRESKFRLSSRFAATFYLIMIVAALGAADFVYARHAFPPVQPTSLGTNPLLNRLAWYRLHVSEYDVIFVGDSRTYCNIHPEVIDPILGTRSLNLGAFTNWFPTQLSMVQELVAHVPRGTTVVWSLGSQNFAPIYTRVGGAIPPPAQRVYPVGFQNAVRYVWWGLSPFDLIDNLFFYNRAFYFLTQRGELRKSFVKWLDTSADGVQTNAEHSGPLEAKVETATLQREYSKDPRVGYVQVLSDAGKVNSVVLYYRGGGYYRIQLDENYFVRRKLELKQSTSLSDISPHIDPAYWKMFEEILRTFKERGVRLVVNEIEEAPFVYGDISHRELWRRFMAEQVQSRMIQLGVPYLRPGFDRLEDGDYFDFDHLNSKGIAKFGPLLAEELAPHLAGRSPWSEF